VLCAKILLNAGVIDIVFRHPYPDPLSAELLAEAGLAPRRLDSTDSSADETDRP
jgi:dCMP deaminase